MTGGDETDETDDNRGNYLASASAAGDGGCFGSGIELDDSDLDVLLGELRLHVDERVVDFRLELVVCILNRRVDYAPDLVLAYRTLHDAEHHDRDDQHDDEKPEPSNRRNVGFGRQVFDVVLTREGVEVGQIASLRVRIQFTLPDDRILVVRRGEVFLHLALVNYRVGVSRRSRRLRCDRRGRGRWCSVGRGGRLSRGRGRWCSVGRGGRLSRGRGDGRNRFGSSRTWGRVLGVGDDGEKHGDDENECAFHFGPPKTVVQIRPGRRPKNWGFESEKNYTH